MDLKEFCKRVRMLIGSPVLVATVKGLQVAQSLKKAEQWERHLASSRVVGGGAEPPGNGTFGAAAATATTAAPPAASTGGAPSASAPPQASGAPHRPSLAPLEVKADCVPSHCAASGSSAPSPAASATRTPPASAAAPAGAYGGAAFTRDTGGTKLL